MKVYCKYFITVIEEWSFDEAPVVTRKKLTDGS